MVGTIVLASGAASPGEKDVTLGGDALALLASCAIVPYLLIGRRLRPWMPLLVYAAPVTGLAALELSLASLLEEAGKGDGQGFGVFGWASTLRHLALVLYLAVVPGIVGHTGKY